MTPIIETADLPTDLQAEELAQTWVDGANATAARVAPCLADSPTPDQLAEARLVLIGTVSRWAKAGSGGLSSVQNTAGPFSESQSFDTRVRTGYNMWPTEITRLQDICKTGGKAKSFALDTAPPQTGIHAPWCSLAFGATYCSCGVDIAGRQIFEP